MPDFQAIVTLLNELRAWMDGGTIQLLLADQNRTAFIVTFCQRMSLKIHSATGTWIPGSFLFNEIEIPIRSTNERIILDALKSFKFSDTIPQNNRPLEREIISDCLSFIESEDYLETARIMGRLSA